ncbi:MAG TPA: carbohydrate kinase family protein [Candidatus Limnocylindrales bacterium]|jgi:sugar/nucleoside kinase (ribokinase family)|nr:carbohydrate kinase family protein [Candidatus Limnocylindrales bacterium]
MSEKPSFYGPPVCVVGNVNRDIKLHGVPASRSILRDGETSVSNVQETIGGGGANSACAAAALGGSVRFVGKIGANALGERLRVAMEKHGVRTYLSRSPKCETGTTVALGFETGQRHFLSCLPNNRSLAFEDLDLTALDSCEHLLRADVWFSESMLGEGNRRLLTEARRRGLATSLDINFDPCWSSDSTMEIARRKHQLRQILPLVDIAHGNIRELCEFTNTTDLSKALAYLAEWGARAVVVHMGIEGAGFYTNGELLVEPPDLAQNPILSTGTGDVLSMGMILLHRRTDLSIQEKLRLANRVVRQFMEGQLDLIPCL